MRVNKTGIGLVSDLADQLAVLDEHIKRARAGDVLAIKIVAPVLRDLVCKYRSNPKPLLFRIAEQYSYQLMVRLDVPPIMKSVMTLEEYLDVMAFASGTEGVILTHYQLIKGVADQQSVAHTDTGISNDIYAAMGWPEDKTTANSPHVYSILANGEVVLAAAHGLMQFVGVKSAA